MVIDIFGLARQPRCFLSRSPGKNGQKMPLVQESRQAQVDARTAVFAPKVRRFLLLSLAVLFGIATVLYTVLWIHYIQSATPDAFLGIDAEYVGDALVITRVDPNSPAEQAGLHARDRIVAVNGRALSTQNPFYDAVSRGRPGDRVLFEIQNAGTGDFLNVGAVLEPRLNQSSAFTSAQRIAAQLINYYQIPFAVVALAVLFLRRDSLHAWLLAFLFAGCITGSPLASLLPLVHPALRGFMLAFMLAFYGLFPAFFYWFFATFPVPSPLDRRLPRLKYDLFILGCLTLPAAIWAGIAASLDPVSAFMRSLPHALVAVLGYGYALSGFGLGLVSLIWNLFAASDEAARRKMRVVVWGNVIGFGPLFLLVFSASLWSRSPWSLPFWIWGVPVLLLGLMPLSFAYAVVKHRVLEIPVLLRRSARYLLVQRGFLSIILLLAVLATLLLASWFSRKYPAQSRLALPLGTGFGVLLVVSGTQLHGRVRQQLDRAFFRSAYDARVVLEDLAAKTRSTTTREELDGLLRQQIDQALHPQFTTLYLASNDGLLKSRRAEFPPLSCDSEFARELADRAEARDAESLDHFPLAAPKPECVVPIVAPEQNRLQGLMILGPRLSEEPYSREDKRLLLSVAMQASTVLRSIGLAETIADRIEGDRRVAQEIEIARQVQRKLLPQSLPRLTTFDYAGECRQARAVGGDYYDFLDLGEGKVGFVLADVAGKGMSAALLMANLQANLRSQSVLAVRELSQLLQSVNRLFFENTEENRYATAFVAVYDDQVRRLTYANCGHNPPLLLCADDSIQHLESTATVLGLFKNFECGIETVQLHRDDLLVLYTDGVTEAASFDGEEFGESRMVASLRADRTLAAGQLVEQLIQAVVEFSPGEQGDDITVVVGKVS